MINEIIERLEKVKRDNCTNFVQREHADIEYLIARVEHLEKALSNIAFGYVGDEYANERHYAREMLPG